jgi:uncharacterized GH25 family protein
VKSRGLVLSVLLVLAILAAGLAGCGARETGIEGTVRQDGKPLAQAEVRAVVLIRPENVTDMTLFQKGDVLARAFTDDQGAFSFALDKGSYVVEVWVGGAKATDRLVEVESGKVSKADFEIEAP